MPAVIRNLEQDMQRARTAGGLPDHIVVLVEDIDVTVTVCCESGFPVISGTKAQACLEDKTSGCMNGNDCYAIPGHTY